LLILWPEIILIASPGGDLTQLSLWWWYTILSDVFDGGLARALGATSEFGEKLDHIIDKLVMAGILIALVEYRMFPWEVAASLFLIYGIVAVLSLLRIAMGLQKPKRLEVGRYAVLGWSVVAWLYMMWWHTPFTAAVTASCLVFSTLVMLAYVRDFWRCWRARLVGR